MSYRQRGRKPQQPSVFRTAPGLVIAAVAVGAAGGMTAPDFIAKWDSLGSLGTSCDIKGNISIDSGERIFHVPGQKYYSETRIRPEYGERWFCSEEEAWAAGWRKAYR
ncbi:sunset domain-containing protein [Sinorhizobium chiapasense]|uniref:Succinoglycan biosynthesis protein exoi n=1 Tax=Sinorhizobium chiapasense TaxID=501572 RepID=A0ABZ2BLF4_9HYPH